MPLLSAASGAQHWLRDTRRFCFAAQVSQTRLRRNRSARVMFLVQKEIRHEYRSDAFTHHSNGHALALRT
jgi:hypothetical protein